MKSVLDNKVLVLNKSYSPIDVITVRRAFIKLFNGIAEVVTVDGGSYYNYDFISWAEFSELKNQMGLFNDGEDVVHTPRLILAAPLVVRLLTYSMIPETKVKLSRKNIYIRDKYTCQYCGRKYPADKLNIDHVVPRSKGGKNTWTNLVCTCHDCNTKKGGHLPREAKMKLLRKPIEPKFNTLFSLQIAMEKYEMWSHFLNGTATKPIPIADMQA